MLTGFLIAACGLCVAMAGAWLAQYVMRNCGWVDVIWSVAMGAAGVLLALWPDPGAFGGRQVMCAVLIALWAARLGGYIAIRSASGPEDARYAALRVEWGTRFQVRLFWFLQTQAAAAMLLALSLMLAAHNAAPFPRTADALAILILLIAVAGEAWADASLSRFRSDPEHRGLVCDTGLWAWSRHPNYFFEWLGWMAWPLIAIDVTGDWWWGVLALSGPAFMYYLLVHVSGIPLLEQHMLRSRGDRFVAYQRRVSAFFPRPAKGPPKGAMR